MLVDADSVPVNVMDPAAVVQPRSVVTFAGVPNVHSRTRMSAVILASFRYMADELIVPVRCKASKESASVRSDCTVLPFDIRMSVAVGSGCW